nr:hypothetical protein [Lachnospiraceae bacterium]
GKVNITFTFKGRYTGTVKKTVNVKARSIAGAVIDIKGSAKYSKAGAVPEAVIVKLGGETLIEGIDYTLSYKNNTKSGVTATVTAKGIGNYTGTISKGFRVEKSLITDCVTLVSADKQFNAKAKAGYFKSVPKLMDGGKAISIGKDVNKFDTKTAFKYYFAASTEEIPDATVVPANTLIKVKVTVTCGAASPYQAGTYELVGYYKILDKGKDLKAAKVKIKDINKLTFNNGKPVVPLKSEDLIVTVGKDNLKADDYDIISVKNNRFLGTATVVIQGKGTYGGTKSFTFKIGARAFK